MTRREESRLLAEIRLAIGTRSDVMLARINTGVYAAIDNPKRRVRSAPTGFPDLILTQRREVIIPRVRESVFGRHEDTVSRFYGQAIAVETKSLTGKQRAAQENWQAAFEAVGGIYILARSVEDVLLMLGEEK